MNTIREPPDQNLAELRAVLASGHRAGWAILAADILDFELPAKFVDEAMKSPEFQQFFSIYLVRLTKTREDRAKSL